MVQGPGLRRHCGISVEELSTQHPKLYALNPLNPTLHTRDPNIQTLGVYDALRARSFRFQPSNLIPTPTSRHNFPKINVARFIAKSQVGICFQPKLFERHLCYL